MKAGDKIVIREENYRDNNGVVTKQDYPYVIIANTAKGIKGSFMKLGEEVLVVQAEIFRQLEKDEREALLACAEELSSIIGLHGDEGEAAKLERSAALRLAKRILGNDLKL